MKIIFLNIWHARREKEVEKFILEQRDSTDVFCFQEAFDNTLELAKKLIPNYQVTTANKTLSKEEDFSLATFVKEPIEMLSVNTILKESPSEGMGLSTTIRWKNNIYNICNVHGVSRPGNKLDTEKRISQSKALINHYQESPNYTVIGGDFNLERETESINMFTINGYADLIKQHGIKTTRNRLAWEKYPNSIQYFSDYVFVNHGLQPTNFQVIDNEVSDHLPLVVEF